MLIAKVCQRSRQYLRVSKLLGYMAEVVMKSNGADNKEEVIRDENIKTVKYVK